jgi:hypothetical protein
MALLWAIFQRRSRCPRYEDAEFRRFLRRYQHLALLVGKREAIRRINQSVRSLGSSSRRQSAGGQCLNEGGWG